MYQTIKLKAGNEWRCSACVPWRGWEAVARPFADCTMRQWMEEAKFQIRKQQQATHIMYRVVPTRWGVEIQRQDICDFHLPVLKAVQEMTLCDTCGIPSATKTCAACTMLIVIHAGEQDGE